MTTPVTGSTGTPGLPSEFGIGSATTNLGQTQSASQDQNTFLKLLVAQLQYQDPASPADPTAYISEMAQFTEVQSLQTIQSQQQQLLASNQLLAAEGMIGGQVTGTGDAGAAITGVVDGVTPTSDGAALTLSDGTTLPVSAVTKLVYGTTAPTTPTPTTPSDSTPPTTGTSTG
ncbi:MAG TPA: flagellar hook capping FlgD N-terminal domain-containing protein [Mycobacteriales bacterium]|nr:flagellar hook capping FlgD N-terminal domain-containing protein [Mycobacteriales bacterium]